VAAFIFHEVANGRDVQGVLAIAASITAAHDMHNLSNPVATAAVRRALEKIVKAEPPRSWNKDERASWALLPPEIRQTITKREDDRDAAVHRKMNEIAKLRKRLEGEADKPIAQTTNGDYEHVTTAQI
jgi:hypothetical protein